MTDYFKYNLTLNEKQTKNIDRAFRNKLNVSIQLKYNQLSGKHQLALTKRQINHIEKCKEKKKGVRLILSYSQLRNNHAGGFLPMLFAALGAVGALATGASSIAEAVMNSKAKNAKLEELKRHNRVMEAKGGGSVFNRAMEGAKVLPLTNLDIQKAAERLEIRNFRGVFMSNELPKRVRKNECGVVNLESSEKLGTHWVCYWKNGNQSYFFDAFGGNPPRELIHYLVNDNSKRRLDCNTIRLQNFNEVTCGHYCVSVLKLLSDGREFKDVLNSFHADRFLWKKFF